MSAAPTGRAPSRQGRFTRFMEWLGSPVSSPSYPEPVNTRVIDPPFSFDTPALNDGFAFTVSIRLHWSATGECSRSALRTAIDGQREASRWHISDTVRRVAREHAPHLPHRAEARINERIKGVRLFTVDGVQLECTAYLRVEAAQPIVRQQQEMWQQRLADQEAHETAKVNVERMNELRELWRDFLSEGMTHWVSPYAARLAENAGVMAQTSAEMVNHRNADTERLLTLIGQVMNAQQSTNVYEFVVSSETVLRNTLTMMGLPVPDPGPGSLFSDSGSQHAGR
ncbi:hypothetical protein [Streptosporangium sp. V21-05]|uniref:hypothetical protein n=1 Tax=Streptosporangium sp. V21-05 TaxID=3446115 RepID=UPI003F539B23